MGIKGEDLLWRQKSINECRKGPQGFFPALAAPVSLREGSSQSHRLHFTFPWRCPLAHKAHWWQSGISDLPHLPPAVKNSATSSQHCHLQPVRNGLCANSVGRSCQVSVPVVGEERGSTIRAASPQAQGSNRCRWQVAQGLPGCRLPSSCLKSLHCSREAQFMEVFNTADICLAVF